MKILILHPNFPGQFRHRAQEFVRDGHDVTFVCQTHYGRKIHGVRRFALKGSSGHEHLQQQKLSPTARDRFRASQFERGLQGLADGGYTPDLVLSHTGWGCGLALPLIWPDAIRLGYMEWMFRVESSLVRFNQTCEWPIFSTASLSKLGLQFAERNKIILEELSACHQIIAPTYWQRLQLPEILRRQCHVIPDGVDRRRFCFDQSSTRSFTLTYGTRGMEAIRGFPEFICELPEALTKFPKLRVEIAGEDEIQYGGKAPVEGSWGAWARSRLQEYMMAGRVTFRGRLPYKDYTEWLRDSLVHVYLTQPYVVSWSLLEAMATGCCIIASDVEPVREFLCPSSAVLVDHRNAGWLSRSLRTILSQPSSSDQLRVNASREAARYDVRSSALDWRTIVNNC